MSKKILIMIIAVILAAGAFFVFFRPSKPPIDISRIILFYRDGCPHCEKVDQFVKDNNVEAKVEFVKLEVLKNKDNGKVLAERAEFCGLDAKEIGVPFLWDGNNCFMGDVDVINFFRDKLK